MLFEQWQSLLFPIRCGPGRSCGWNVDCCTHVCFLDPGMFQLYPERLYGSGGCGWRACRCYLCRDRSVDSESLLICSCVWWSVHPGDCACRSCIGSRHCGCARSVLPWTNQQLVRMTMRILVFIDASRSCSGSRHCGCARFVFPSTNLQLERKTMSSWSVWCKQQLHG